MPPRRRSTRSINSAPLVGSERPRLSTEPLRKLTRATSRGYELADFADQVLGEPLLPWQRWLAIHGLELDAAGRYRFRTVVAMCGRQNGKTSLLRTMALWRMYLDGAELVLGAAQTRDIAKECWRRAARSAQAVPLLRAEIDSRDGRPREANGDEEIVLRNGARYRITATTEGAGRGYSVDLLVMDEIRQMHDWKAWSALSKDLPNSTPILRADGEWTDMGGLVAGDRIFAPSGKPATVTAVHPVAQLRPMYRLTTTDGRSLVASESHLWSVRDDRESHDPSKAWKMLTTAQILAAGLRYKAGGTAVRWRMPVQHGLCDLPTRTLAIDPYVLGAWLGDGTTADGTLTVGAADLEALCAELVAAGAVVTSTTQTRPGVWRVRLHIGGRPLRTALRDAGLLGNKHVPPVFMTASTEQRVALLCGLMDTDGSVTRAGDVSFTNKNEGLARSVQFLARSLGWNARLSSFVPKIGGRPCGTAWRVTFCLRAGDVIPFRLPRKAGRFTPRLNPLRGTGILSIEPAGTEPSTCIAVDSDDHLFLAGTDLVPTHNTTMARPNGQIWAISNAGDDQSVVLNSLRESALAGRDPSIGLFEWSAPDGCDLDDPKAWAAANPGLGHTVSVQAIRSALGTDPPAVFRTEVLSQRVESLDGAVDAGAWRACQDPVGSLDGLRDRVVVCVDVAPDGQHVTLAAAAITADGRVRVEIVEAWTSTESARRELPDLLARVAPIATAWYPGGPAAALGLELRSAPGSTEIKGADVVEVCQEFADLVSARRVVHPGDGLLDAHVFGAKKYHQGDGWRFVRRGAGHVDALYATAGAAHLARVIDAETVIDIASQVF